MDGLFQHPVSELHRCVDGAIGSRRRVAGVFAALWPEMECSARDLLLQGSGLESGGVIRGSGEMD